ncbi:hypothetical protein K8352_15235 [Flavobacteriaceae bacterium F89]|uniref:Uncharacterized protein n=1 Tax=Cerina litoralis TaxID=2874477 RepID=A0AAE3EYL9_9FLAO|nr:hypothetical protein [Cerina litoralis]MCG2462112.1 hypothetical protein [Cerina litoralis]
MSKETARWSIAMGVVIVGFVLGIYLQDLKHQESTKAAWKANRFNLTRFNKIMQFAGEMDGSNWYEYRDSIRNQMDSLMILRFRKEMDSLQEVENRKE